MGTGESDGERGVVLGCGSTRCICVHDECESESEPEPGR